MLVGSSCSEMPKVGQEGIGLSKRWIGKFEQMPPSQNRQRLNTCFCSSRLSRIQSGTALNRTGKLMLMRAAQLAKDSGVKGFVIVDRRNYRRTETVRNAYTSTTYSAGFRSEADVKFAVPGSGWQVFDADQVWADLAPYYVAPTATAAR